jgi:hypothetical protein
MGVIWLEIAVIIILLVQINLCYAKGGDDDAMI